MKKINIGHAILNRFCLNGLFVIVLLMPAVLRAQNLTLNYNGNELTMNGKIVGGYYSGKDFIRIEDIASDVTKLFVAGESTKSDMLVFKGNLNIAQKTLIFYSRYYKENIKFFLQETTSTKYYFNNKDTSPGIVVTLNKDLRSLAIHISGPDNDGDQFRYMAIFSIANNIPAN